MALVLWIHAVILVASGIVAIVRGQMLWGIVLIVVGCIIMLGLWLGFERTRMGAQIRAAVDNRRMAESLGINLNTAYSRLRRGRQSFEKALRSAQSRPDVQRPVEDVPPLSESNRE